jgi:hypothetical protein
MYGGSIIDIVEDVSLENLKVVRHPYEAIEEEKQSKMMRAILKYTYYWDESARRIYRKSPVAPWLEKYLRYDDAEYTDILRYNEL